MSERTVQSTELQTYLRDHLGGAQAGLALASHLIERAAGTPLADVLTPVRDEIAEDREALRLLIAHAGEQPHSWKEAAGWLAEKLARLKLELCTDRLDSFPLFEGLEALALGILGKRSLWQALAAAGVPLPAGVDLLTLEARAVRQHAIVERERVSAARQALAS